MSFDPLGNPALSMLCIAVGLCAAFYFVWAAGWRGIWRAGATVMFALILANPVVEQPLTRAAPGKSILLMDHSASMQLNGGLAVTPRAREMIAAKYPGQNFTSRSFSASSAPQTELSAALAVALDANQNPGTTAITVMTDGQVHDWAALTKYAASPVPINIVIVGDPRQPDARLKIRAASPFTLVGGTATVDIEVGGGPAGTRYPVAWQIDGVAQPVLSVLMNTPTRVTVPVRRRGDLQVSFAIAPQPGELNLTNNQDIATLKGVRDRLKVLLVSGAPYPGVRLWRDTLKSDPAIDLVHFTILRLPTSLDYTPNDQLSLIPFPVEQLFNERLPGFDLVIFDSFGALDLLDPIYFANVADYVRNGGGVLVIAGAEFGGSESLASTALGQLLPLAPAGPEVVRSFVPVKTALGKIHPLTAPLAEPWGAWEALQPSRSVMGDTLLAEPAGRPLLQIAKVDRGRVSVLASNDLWIWARGTPPGPWAELVRRLAHWLMQEPDLEFGRLTARADAASIHIESRGTAQPSAAVSVTDPAGRTARHPLNPEGIADVPTGQAGLYTVRKEGQSAGQSVVVRVGTRTPELENVTPTLELLRPLARATGGIATVMGNTAPDLAFTSRPQQLLVGTTAQPLIPLWLGLMLGLASLVMVWLMERRR